MTLLFFPGTNLCLSLVYDRHFLPSIALLINPSECVALIHSLRARIFIYISRSIDQGDLCGYAETQYSGPTIYRTDSLRIYPSEFNELQLGIIQPHL